MLLGDIDIKKRLIVNDSEIELAREWWRTGNWQEVGDKLIIAPFNEEKLRNCGYDLSIGHQYISLRRPHEVRDLLERQRFWIEPGEFILILTQENLCLPRNLAGLVVPRARLVFEGTSLSASKVDPTWYGRLVVGFRNHTKSRIWLVQGEPFCTCMFFVTGEVDRSVKELGLAFLGRKDLNDFGFSRLTAESPISPDQVRLSDLDEIVEQHGKPWDIIRGVIRRTKEEIEKYIDEETAPNITREATNNAVRHAYRTMQNQHWALLALYGTLLAGIGALVWNAFFSGGPSP